MRKIALATSVLLLAAACTKHDPILPGDRADIFPAPQPVALDITIENLPGGAVDATGDPCPYTQDASNVIRDGERKIFSGFPTNNSVKATRHPVCAGGHVIAGLTTGEVVKVHPKTRKIAWIADVFRENNMTGGAAVVDIIAPIVVDGAAVYTGGLGDAFCKLNLNNGAKKWCVPISVDGPFIITQPAAFVKSGDTLYAVRTSDGAIYWALHDAPRAAMEYKDGIITIGRTKIDAASGQIIK